MSMYKTKFFVFTKIRMLEAEPCLLKTLIHITALIIFHTSEGKCTFNNAQCYVFEDCIDYENKIR